MNGVRARDLRGTDDRGDVQIAVGTSGRADADILVGEAHVKRALVSLRVHSDRLDTELTARKDDAERDLAAVRDQDLLEHYRTLIAKRRSPYWTGWPFSTYTFAISPSYSESISFMSFIASMMQS